MRCLCGAPCRACAFAGDVTASRFDIGDTVLLGYTIGVEAFLELRVPGPFFHLCPRHSETARSFYKRLERLFPPEKKPTPCPHTHLN